MRFSIDTTAEVFTDAIFCLYELKGSSEKCGHIGLLTLIEKTNEYTRRDALETFLK